MEFEAVGNMFLERINSVIDEFVSCGSKDEKRWGRRMRSQIQNSSETDIRPNFK